MIKERVYQKENGKRKMRMRIAVVGVFFVGGFSAITYRCIYLHSSGDVRLEKIAKSQYRTKIEEVVPRGNIYDAQGEELAISVPAYSVAVRPKKIKDRDGFIQKISTILNMKPTEVSEKLNPEKNYVWLKRFVSPREKEDMTQADMDGVELVKGAKRFYPNREVGSQILGAVGLENNGLSGLELSYDKYLKGSQGTSVAFHDARGKAFETEETINQETPEEIRHLHLTLRKNIQFVTETELNKGCSEAKAKSCSAIVLDPDTGQVMAMASYPPFNPNSYQSYEMSTWRNIAVTDTYEPGSTFKVIMAATAPEKKVARSTDKFFCEKGAYKIGDHVIHDHEAYTTLSLRDILKVSSNVGIYKVGMRVGRQVFGDFVAAFGFGKKTGIDYPGEVPGYVRPASKWQEIEFANVSFGQGVSVTPLQMAVSFATIANEGVRMKPYLVSKITDNQGNPIFENKPQEVTRVLSPETAHTVIDMMTEVSREGGTATRAALPGYNVAGKTGTAQKVIAGKYSHTKFVSSFIGIVPQESPRLVILVTVDEPQGQVYGGVVAAPIFREIGWAALRDLGVPPEKSFNVGTTLVASADKKNTKNEIVHEKKDEPIVSMGMMDSAAFGFPAGSSASAQGSGELMPDFRGLSKRKVISLFDSLGVQGEIYGNGIAISQVPAPGSKLGKNTVCKVYFKSE